MKKTAKILSIVLSISMVIGVALALVFSAFAANAPTFELKEIKKTASEIVLEINLTDGKVSNLDISFNQKGVTCTSIESDDAIVNPSAPAGFSNISLASLKGVSAPATIATVTLKVNDVDNNSFSINIDTCGVPDSADDVAASVKVVNNNVSYKAPTTTTTTKAPTTTTTTKAPTTTTTTKAPTTTTTTKAPATTTTTKAPATTTTTKAPATTTTTKAPTTTTADGNTPATTTAAADAPAAPSANPSTGESVAAAVAAVAVLGISGAAVVALRKKED